MTTIPLPATIIPARFAIDTGTGVISVAGYHDPAHTDDPRNNGFASPWLTADSVDVLAARLTMTDDSTAVVREGDDVTILTSGYDPQPIAAETTSDGVTVWRFDGWVWSVVDQGAARSTLRDLVAEFDALDDDEDEDDEVRRVMLADIVDQLRYLV
jgi:hypothetical protein